MAKCHLSICINRRPADHLPCCGKKGSMALMKEMKTAFEGIAEVKPAMCMGYCNQGPNVRIITDSKEQLITEADISKIKQGIDNL